MMRLVDDVDLGVRFALDARFVQSPSLPDPAPTIHIPSAHFTLSVPTEGWLASLHLVEAIGNGPVTSSEELQAEVEHFLTMQRSWPAERFRVLQPCEATQLASLPATVTRFVVLPGPVEDEEAASAASAGALAAEVYTEQWAVYAPERKIMLDLTVLPPERRESEARALELPLWTLEVLPRT